MNNLHSLIKRVVILENLLISKSVKNEKYTRKYVYHASPFKFSQLRPQPTFFAINKNDSYEWYKNFLDDVGLDGKAYMYKGIVKPSANILEVDEFINELKLTKEEFYDYMTLLMGNPSSKEITSNKITKMALKNGIDGIKYKDYDPRNFSEGTSDAVLLFNPRVSLQSFTQENPYSMSDEDKEIERRNAVKRSEEIHDRIMSLLNRLGLDNIKTSAYSGGIRKTVRCGGDVFNLPGHKVLIMIVKSDDSVDLSAGMDGHIAYKYDKQLNSNMNMNEFKSIIKELATTSADKYVVNQSWFDTI